MGHFHLELQTWRSPLIPVIDYGLEHTSNIGILGASVTQHPEFEKLVNHLVDKNEQRGGEEKLHVQIASVRADTITKSLAEGLSKLGIKSVTMAIESGSEKLREIINKKISNETIINSIQTLFNAGIHKVKLYGMVGLPQETGEDLQETIKLLKKLKTDIGKQKADDGGQRSEDGSRKSKVLSLSFGCSVFVPKAGTPFQYFGVDKSADKKLKLLQKELGKSGIAFKPESYKWSLIQALISRGNKSVNFILEKAWEYGGTLGAFNKAMKEYDQKAAAEGEPRQRREDGRQKAEYFIHDSWFVRRSASVESLTRTLTKRSYR